MERPLRNQSQRAFFINRYMKYLVEENKVRAVVFNYQERILEAMGKKRMQCRGLSEEEAEARRSEFGEGAMVTEVPSFFSLFIS